MKYSVCVDALFRGKDFLESAGKLKSAGFTNIEFWAWWNKDVDSIGKFIKENGITVTAFCTKMVSLTDPAVRSDYIKGLQESILAAKKLGCKTLISQTGKDTGAPRAEQKASLIAGLSECVPFLREAGITLVVEPLNIRVDHKGYFLFSSDEAAEIIMAVGSDRVKILYDIYHQQVTEGDIVSHIKQHIYSIGHFHAAGVPGRHELDDSELDYKKVFAEIDKLGYSGYVGLEYFPLCDPIEGLQNL